MVLMGVVTAATKLRLSQRGQAEQLGGFGGPLEPPHLPARKGFRRGTAQLDRRSDSWWMRLANTLSIILLVIIMLVPFEILSLSRSAPGLYWTTFHGRFEEVSSRDKSVTWWWWFYDACLPFRSGCCCCCKFYISVSSSASDILNQARRSSSKSGPAGKICMFTLTSPAVVLLPRVFNSTASCIQQAKSEPQNRDFT